LGFTPQVPVNSADETVSEELFMEPLTALLLSTDPGPRGTTEKVLEEYGFSVKVAGSVAAASQLIKSTKFDLAIYDNDVPGALDLAAGRSPLANPKLVFALVRNTNRNEATGKRVHFVVQKPFTADLFARSLRAAYGTMLRDRRISFRHPVQIKPLSTVLVQERGNQTLQASTIVDLSQTGLCIHTLEILPQGASLEIEFKLPEDRGLIHVTGSVMWTRASGRTGVKFVHVPPAEQKTLTLWLDSLLPYSVEGIAKPLRNDHGALQLQT
jgi:DNA-binding response OmpR family regulator